MDIDEFNFQRNGNAVKRKSSLIIRAPKTMDVPCLTL